MLNLMTHPCRNMFGNQVDTIATLMKVHEFIVASSIVTVVAIEDRISTPTHADCSCIVYSLQVCHGVQNNENIEHIAELKVFLRPLMEEWKRFRSEADRTRVRYVRDILGLLGKPVDTLVAAIDARPTGDEEHGMESTLPAAPQRTPCSRRAWSSGRQLRRQQSGDGSRLTTCSVRVRRCASPNAA
jgi:hypothetical protein